MRDAFSYLGVLFLMQNLQIRLDETTPLLNDWLHNILPLFASISAFRDLFEGKNLLVHSIAYKRMT